MEDNLFKAKIIENYEPGDFGCAKFDTLKKGVKGSIEAYGTIKAVERKVVLFQDNDGFDFLVDRKSFNFEKKKFQDKSKT